MLVFEKYFTPHGVFHSSFALKITEGTEVYHDLTRGLKWQSSQKAPMVEISEYLYDV